MGVREGWTPTLSPIDPWDPLKALKQNLRGSHFFQEANMYKWSLKCLQMSIIIYLKKILFPILFIIFFKIGIIEQSVGWKLPTRPNIDPYFAHWGEPSGATSKVCSCQSGRQEGKNVNWHRRWNYVGTCDKVLEERSEESVSSGVSPRQLPCLPLATFTPSLTGRKSAVPTVSLCFRWWVSEGNLPLC